MEKARTLPGFMELLPNEQIKFNNIIDIIRKTYERHGFLPIDTPIIEDTNVLLAKAGGETQKQMYSFKKGDHDLSLRFDLTVPLAKYVALYQNDITFPFKRYQIGKVYRGEKPQKGRYREFYQCDIDIIGNETLALSNDAEVVAIVSDIFDELNIGKYVIRTNNRKVLNGVFQYLAIQEQSDEMLRLIDKLDKIGLEELKNILSEMLDEKRLHTLLDILLISGTNEEKLEKLNKLKEQINNETFSQGLLELETLYNDTKSYGKEDKLQIDISIVRGLDYYTGNVFETNLVEHKELGSICSGGRYDNLASVFTNKKMPGVGISIGLTRLFYLLNEYNLIKKENSNLIDYYVISMEKEFNSYAIKVANVLRKKGSNVQLNLEDMKIAKKFKIADKLNLKKVIIIGQTETQEDKITLKNMETGEQQLIDINELS